ncbi:potassium-transporting ATPase subunit C [Streptomyces sp. SID8379]|uniref:potassium-transporting ATPase subunit C n=1 Tax=unclassified Streptomyces TaxID=2593676 RepID=UPI0004760F56|nr:MULTISPECIES: potassium-transporting ATPase subunit C [unclassified Streptomyces]MYW64409.1 potassium-transporting ATPase subunit C [Streptomyces sp. SID8379]
MNNSVGNTGRLLWAGLRALVILTVVCGVIYPLAVTGVAQAVFHDKANGSEIKDSEGKVVGSSLIGQSYTDKDGKADLKWFQGRPQNGLGENSVNTQYKLILSGATNLSGDSGADPKTNKCKPLSAYKSEDDQATLCYKVLSARDAVIADNSTATYKVKAADIPADAVTSSGSGLDPAISPEYADLQVHRVAEKNHLSVAQVQKLVDQHTSGRQLGFMGEPTVNVLKLNIALKELVAKR